MCKYKDILLDARVMIRLADDLFSENIVDCIDGDIVAMELCFTVAFIGMNQSLEPLTSVL